MSEVTIDMKNGNEKVRVANVRWSILGPGIAITAGALSLYFLDVSGNEFFLFIAGLTGGMSLAELALSLERGEGRRHHDELIQDNDDLSEQLRNVQEPALAAAVRVGADSVTVGSSPDTEPAQFLQVSDELRSMADVNDVLGVTNFLSTRWGEAVSESFLLGRQLVLLLLPTTEASPEARDLVCSRLRLRARDDQLADVVDGVLTSRAGMNDESARTHMRFIAALAQYLFRSTTTPEANATRMKLLLGLEGFAEDRADSSQDERTAATTEALEALIDAGVGERDPEVLFWWGIATNDPEIVADAVGMGADSTVTDVDVLRRYREFLVPS